MLRRRYDPGIGPRGPAGFHEDYLMRQIRALGDFLRALMGRRGSAAPEELRRQIDAAGEELVGVSAGELSEMPEEDLILLVAPGGHLDPGLSLTAATLLKERGRLEAALGDGDSAASHYRMALALYVEALLSEERLRVEEYRNPVRVLIAELRDQPLPLSLRDRLFRYHEAVGDYDRAEDELYRLRDLGYPDWAAEARRFYQRLLAKSDEQLEAGRLPREEVEEGLSEVS